MILVCDVPQTIIWQSFYKPLKTLELISLSSLMQCCVSIGVCYSDHYFTCSSQRAVSILLSDIKGTKCNNQKMFNKYLIAVCVECFRLKEVLRDVYNQLVSQSINHLVNQSINQSISQSVIQLINQLVSNELQSIHQSIHTYHTYFIGLSLQGISESMLHYKI